MARTLSGVTLSGLDYEALLHFPSALERGTPPPSGAFSDADFFALGKLWGADLKPDEIGKLRQILKEYLTLAEAERLVGSVRDARQKASDVRAAANKLMFTIAPLVPAAERQSDRLVLTRITEAGRGKVSSGSDTGDGFLPVGGTGTLLPENVARSLIERGYAQSTENLSPTPPRAGPADSDAASEMREALWRRFLERQALSCAGSRILNLDELWHLLQYLAEAAFQTEVDLSEPPSPARGAEEDRGLFPRGGAKAFLILALTDFGRTRKQRLKTGPGGQDKSAHVAPFIKFLIGLLERLPKEARFVSPGKRDDGSEGDGEFNPGTVAKAVQRARRGRQPTK